MLEKLIKKIMPFIAAGAVSMSSCDIVEEWDDGTDDDGPVYSREETIKNENMHEGVNVTSWEQCSYASQTAKHTLEYLHELGVESASVLTTYYCNETDIFPTDKTPNDSGLKDIIRKAQSLGMRTVLKPHVDTISGFWRGYISFSTEQQWSEWFANYENFISHYAQIAEDENIDLFVIGTELAGTTHRHEWENIIDKVRSIYSGKIVYAANHDEYKNILFWKLLDYFGVDGYFSLTNSDDPSASELIERWQSIVDELESFSYELGMQMILTEGGYQSRNGTNTTPWWVSSRELDFQEQADCYYAMLDALFNKPFVAGIYLWKAYYNPELDFDDFEFIGKPAELVAADFYQRIE